MRKKMRQATVWITPTEYEILQRLAGKHNITSSEFLRSCLTDAFADEGFALQPARPKGRPNVQRKREEGCALGGESRQAGGDQSP